jgi:hypothetical protein
MLHAHPSAKFTILDKSTERGRLRRICDSLAPAKFSEAQSNVEPQAHKYAQPVPWPAFIFRSERCAGGKEKLSIPRAKEG